MAGFGAQSTYSLEMESPSYQHVTFDRSATVQIMPSSRGSHNEISGM